MPHDVTMPQLGMAQDAGKIVSWLKAPGDAVVKGDLLFEVETDKATMEVEAQASGFLTCVVADAGDDVPVGAVIARISNSAEEEKPAPAGDARPADDLPEGHSVTMPQLGMAQDSGVLVSWQKAPGDAVAAGDMLFEVETDKSTMEVEAGRDGYLAATLAEAGEEVPVGEPVAIISAEAPANPVARSVASAPPAPTARPEAEAEPEPDTRPEPAKPAQRASGGRILASPKARRLALEQGLDLAKLVEAGHPQPYHVRDLETLRALPAATPASEVATATTRMLTAEIGTDGLAAFADWAAEAHGLTDADALLAGLAGASLSPPCIVAVERFGQARHFAVPAGRALSAVGETEDAPDLILRDLRGTAIRSLAVGAEASPVLTLMTGGTGLSVTLECGPAQLDAQTAITLLSDFAGRVEQPLRHLL
ncbi:MAG: pyruvate dehydrogenase E2 component (dihydrolipoamide acetyltransferase) [Rhodobacteraceae bacterium HLUCCO07]|nr:MAG: pyruvate dehydrogenase E2 component (dihydrolipoamide acetyltransferase) [Rhodobacteraceae bacterium HLUCCO07]